MEENFSVQESFLIGFNSKTKHRAGSRWTGIITKIILTNSIIYIIITCSKYEMNVLLIDSYTRHM